MKFTPNTDLIRTLATQQKNTKAQLKSTGPVVSTGKPSRVLKNSSGLRNEIKCSRPFHDEGLPLLISPILLRDRNIGQIDLARLNKDSEGWIIEIGEVKSSELGQLQMARFQKDRLSASQRFLSGVFGFRGKLVCLIGRRY